MRKKLKSARERRPRKNSIQSISFYDLPGEIRNMIYDTIIIAIRSTTKPWQRDNYERADGRIYCVPERWSYTASFLLEPGHFPWFGFQYSTRCILQEFRSRFYSGMEFIYEGVRPILFCVAGRPMFDYIRHLTLGIGTDQSLHLPELWLTCFNWERGCSHPENSSLTYGPWDPRYPEWMREAVSKLGQEVIFITQVLALKTLCLNVALIQENDGWNGHFGMGLERCLLRKIKNLVSTDISVFIQHSSFAPENLTGDRTPLATVLELMSKHIKQEKARRRIVEEE